MGLEGLITHWLLGLLISVNLRLELVTTCIAPLLVSGKGGVRMAPEEALAEILQVPLGCVTPFSLVNETARHVSLILDQGFRSKECCVFHPLSNDMSIMLSAHDLDKFLKSIGRNPAYVDLEVTPVVGKDQPPDLASLVPSDTTALSEPAKLVTTSQVPLQNHDVQDNKPLKVTENGDQDKECEIHALLAVSRQLGKQPYLDVLRANQD